MGIESRLFNSSALGLRLYGGEHVSGLNLAAVERIHLHHRHPPVVARLQDRGPVAFSTPSAAAMHR